MLSVAEAQARVMEPVTPMASEWVGLNEALGRVLATDLVAGREQPPCDVSAMDGYAVRAADCDVGASLRLVGEIPAGHPPPGPVGRGEAMRIFTGAAVPEGADAILIEENATREGETVQVNEAPSAGRFIRPRGLDFNAGDVGFVAGTRIDPRVIGLAAGFGHAWLEVRRRPRIGLLATGDELVLPGGPVTSTSIVSSNTPALMAMLASWGALPVDLGIARDEPESLAERLRHTADLDMVVTTGGASVGQYDLIRPVLSDAGLELGFWKIAMRPGKPLIFGRFRDRPFLGLPGNPVSASVCAIMFLRPMIMGMLGTPCSIPFRQGRLAVSLDANDQRQDYLRSTIADDDDGGMLVRPAGRQDSSMFRTFARSDALAVRPPFDPPRKSGEPIEFMLLTDVLTR